MVSRTLQRKLERKKFENWINWINAFIAVFTLLFMVDRGKSFNIILYKGDNFCDILTVDSHYLEFKMTV